MKKRDNINLKIRQCQIHLITILILFMTFHYLLFAVLLKSVSVLKLWRDGIMILIFALELLKGKGLKRDITFAVDIVFLTLNVIYIVLAPNIFPALNVARVYIVPFMLFHAVKNLDPTPQEVSTLLKRLMVCITICCVYGLVQAYVLGPGFLVKIGYENTNGVLSHTYFLSNYNGSAVGREVQRVVSTFSSANVCAFYLCSAFIIFLFSREKVQVKAAAYYGFMFLVFATVVLTFSRSCWLAIAVALILFGIKQIYKFVVNGWKAVAVLAALVVVAIIAMPPLQRALLHIIKSSFSGSDTSVLNHFSTLTKGADAVAANPWGLGLGANGPRALNYGPSNLVESSFFLMAFEYGVFGAVVYFFKYVFLAVKAVQNRRKSKTESMLSLCLLTFIAVAYFNIPYVQEIECTSLILIVLAYLNSTLEKKDCTASSQIAPEQASSKEETMDLKEFCKMCLGIVKRIPLLISQFFPRSKDIYIFGAWYGQKFSDNSRAVYQYAVSHTDKTCFWICNNKELYKKMKAEGYPALMMYSPKGIYYQLRACVAVSTTGAIDFWRELLGGCVHVELWHGVGGGKKIGFDDRKHQEFAKSFRYKVYSWMEKNALRKHYFVCTSDTMKEVFKTAFLIPDDHFIYAGQARNDMFYDESYQPATVSREEFGGKYVIAYMPTHRKDGQEKMEMSRILDLDAIEAFCEKHDAIFLIKKHFYHAAEVENLEKYPHIMDISSRQLDTNELLLTVDYLISDYSSVATDYLLLNRPVSYYCYDYDDYVSSDREMYWDFDTVIAGKRLTTFEELMNEMKQVIDEGIDVGADHRKRVRDMFYAPACQCSAADKIMNQIEDLLEKQ